jgi:hypothetical protein
MVMKTKLAALERAAYVFAGASSPPIRLRPLCGLRRELAPPGGLAAPRKRFPLLGLQEMRLERGFKGF